MAVAAKDVLPGEDDFLVGDTDVDTKTDDAREGHNHGNGMNLPSTIRVDELRFTKIQKNDCLFNVTDAHRLVVLIEDEHLAA